MGELPLAMTTGGDASLDSVEMPLEKECLLEVSLNTLGGYTSSYAQVSLTDLRHRQEP